MKILKIEIKDYGVLKVTHDLRHRPKMYLKTEHHGRLQQVQFDLDPVSYIHNDNFKDRWFLGYDYEANDISIRILSYM